MAFASISTDLYLPAIPTMARDLHAGEGQMAFTITGFLIGFSLGQLAWGPLSDRAGRRGPLLAGTILFLAGTAGCALSGSGAALIGWRLLQALGASAGVVLSRAMVRDLHSGDRAAQVLSGLMAVMAVAPLVGPLAGGQILVAAGWRAIFWTMTGVGLFALFAITRLPETLPPEARNGEGLVAAFRAYGSILSDRDVAANAGACGFFFFGTFAYIAASPSAYIVFHHVPPRLYGLLFALGIVGIVLLNTLNARLVAGFGSARLLRAGAFAAALSGLIALVGTVFAPSHLVALVLPMFAFVSVTGVVVANALGLALSARLGQAGAVAAVVGAVQYGSGVAGSAMVGLTADGTPVPMAVMVALGGIGCLACAASAGGGADQSSASRC